MNSKAKNMEIGMWKFTSDSYSFKVQFWKSSLKRIELFFYQLQN